VREVPRRFDPLLREEGAHGLDLNSTGSADPDEGQPALSHQQIEGAPTHRKPARGFWDPPARNRLAGALVSVEKDGVMAEVELACGDYRIVSLMSREAADELGLASAYRLWRS
jgi:molybdopterin-binding protein